MYAALLSSAAVTTCASDSWMDSDMGPREEIHSHYPTINTQGNPLHVAVRGGPVQANLGEVNVRPAVLHGLVG